VQNTNLAIRRESTLRTFRHVRRYRTLSDRRLPKQFDCSRSEAQWDSVHFGKHTRFPRATRSILIRSWNPRARSNPFWRLRLLALASNRIENKSRMERTPN